MSVAPGPGEAPPPTGWGDDPLSEFLKFARHNQLVTFATKRADFTLLGMIDSAFLRVGNNLINPKNILSANLFYRSHSAYRAACGTALAGQVPETFVLLRSCLEYAGYGLHIFKKPALGTKWLNRHQGPDAMRVMKKEFQAVNVQKVVASVDAQLGEVYKILYDRAIDFGGHPNVMGVTGNMLMDDRPEQITVTHLYLHGNDDALAMGLKSTAQAGATSLHVFQHVFQERFMLLGVREILMKLRTMNL